MLLSCSSLKERKKLHAAIPRLFGSKILTDLAKNGRSELFATLFKDLQFIQNFDPETPLGEFYDDAFKILQKPEFRNEYVYRNALTQKLLLGTHSLTTAVMMNEFRVRSNKADVVLLNGTSTVYEIKSERDSLERLQHQVESYLTVFANVNVITGENHLNKVLKTVPDEVGVLVLSNRNQISVERKSSEDFGRISAEEIFKCVRTEEAKEILSYNGIEIPKCPNTKIRKELLILFREISSELLHKSMLRTLKHTRTHLPLSDLLNSVPLSVQGATLGLSLRKQDYNNFLSVFHTPLRCALSWA